MTYIVMTLMWRHCNNTPSKSIFEITYDYVSNERVIMFP